MSAWAKPGVKCVHIVDESHCNGKGTIGANYPVPGEVYTIRKIVYHYQTGKKLLLLKELDNDFLCALLGLRKEPGFEVVHFRPVAYPSQSIEHDIALFLDTPAHVRTSDKERA